MDTYQDFPIRQDLSFFNFLFILSQVYQHGLMNPRLAHYSDLDCITEYVPQALTLTTIVSINYSA